MIAVHSHSEAGGHPLNEDAFVVQSHPLDPECWICLVADGQGGQSGGGTAARLACRTALDAALDTHPKQLIDPRCWDGIFRRADAAIVADRVAGFTTLVGLCVRGGRLAGASNGDSAALLISAGNPVNLTASQRKNPPIGSGAAIAVPFDAAVTDPWKVLAMSDGVWQYVGWDRVIEVALRTRGETLVAELQLRARLPATDQLQDDFTAIVFESPSGDSQR